MARHVADELEARARALGYQTLHLDTSILQIPAQRLYEKNGFREVGRDLYQGLEVILYEKQLSVDRRSIKALLLLFKRSCLLFDGVKRILS